MANGKKEAVSGKAPETEAKGPAPETEAKGPAPETEAKGPAPETNVAGGVPATTDAVQGDGKTGNSVQTDGVRARRGLTQKMLLPDPDWINKNIVGGGKGTRGTIGRIYGIVTKADRKINVVNDRQIESIVLVGMFDMESYITGEVSRGSSWYPPMSYGEMVEAAFKSDPSLLSVDVDCDIGLEATGKPIPYEWVCTAFREGNEMSTLKRLKGTRNRPTSLLAAPDGTPKSLPSPTSAPVQSTA